MNPNKLPPLPELPAPRGTVRVYVNGGGDETRETAAYTAGQMHDFAIAYAEALRQSQSLPAGAVAGLVEKWRINSEICSGTGAVERAVELSRCADQLRDALQADAREKGEAVELDSSGWPKGLVSFAKGYKVMAVTVPDGYKLDVPAIIGGHVKFLATQPAQASEDKS